MELDGPLLVAMLTGDNVSGRIVRVTLSLPSADKEPQITASPEPQIPPQVDSEPQATAEAEDEPQIRSFPEATSAEPLTSAQLVQELAAELERLETEMCDEAATEAAAAAAAPPPEYTAPPEYTDDSMPLYTHTDDGPAVLRCRSVRVYGGLVMVQPVAAISETMSRQYDQIMQVRPPTTRQTLRATVSMNYASMQQLVISKTTIRGFSVTVRHSADDQRVQVRLTPKPPLLLWPLLSPHALLLLHAILLLLLFLPHDVALASCTAVALVTCCCSCFMLLLLLYAAALATCCYSCFMLLLLLYAAALALCCCSCYTLLLLLYAAALALCCCSCPTLLLQVRELDVMILSQEGNIPSQPLKKVFAGRFHIPRAASGVQGRMQGCARAGCKV